MAAASPGPSCGDDEAELIRLTSHLDALQVARGNERAEQALRLQERLRARSQLRRSDSIAAADPVVARLEAQVRSPLSLTC
eukprot:m.183559 g.183559  ORF g.183559 m.183559 type:complete len:81 (-) comp10496_c0_seq8:4660-4902(-)